ncbi:hypothetical protein [Peribacillus acanthi]|uniref:hypothetical protein n=1 Tax=Peribacillus acanthi TaxID=2171554 RepID=UPI000D3E94FB|nr:hypothetical protein [Peribacillus acanthi]
MAAIGLTRDLLSHLYTNKGYSDKEIADFVGLDRTSIVHMRHTYNIEARRSVGEIGERYVFHKLLKLGHTVVDMNKFDKTSIFDLLADGKCKIEVKSANMDKNSFYFSLSNKAELQHVESDHRIKLKNGRTRKLYRKTCDYMILVGFDNKRVYPFIVPSNEIDDRSQGIRITLKRDNKYWEYFQKWEQLKKPSVGAEDPQEK